MSLTPKRARFVVEILVDRNASAAAKRAGYSAKTADKIGWELMQVPEIRAAIDEAEKARAERVGLTADRVLLELERLALVDLGQAFDENGALLPVQKMPEGVRRALAGVDVIEMPGESGGLLKKVKLCSKEKALELAMRHLGMLRDKVEHELTGQGWADLVEAAMKPKAP